jgi:hypothetical protein
MIGPRFLDALFNILFNIRPFRIGIGTQGFDSSIGGYANDGSELPFSSPSLFHPGSIGYDPGEVL